MRRAIFAILLGTLAVLACGEARRSVAPPQDVFPGAPVVLISIDTLRSDRLPAYGYPHVDTPAIDSLRRDGILFERAYCHYPLTLPSHASMFTGLLPGDHGVRDNVGYLLEADGLPYLPREVRELGYATGAAVSAFVLRQETGLGAHFDFYEDGIETRGGVGLGALQRRGDETLDLARDWLRAERQQPIFFFFHIFEPHTPYAPPEPFASRYAHPYDGEVAAADAVVGDLLAELRRLDLYDPALIILLSDHGEGLGDHGEDEHGILLYREALQVPLLVKLPGGRRAGETVRASAQLIDVYSTVLALVGGDPDPRSQGRSLLALADRPEERPIYAETFYPRLHYGWSELHSLIEDGVHYIEGPEPELYDLERDFRQTRNLLPGERPLYARMRRELAALKRPLALPGEVDPETARKLAALGYLASGPAAPEGPLPDPKSRIHVLDDLALAQRRMGEGSYLEAVTLYREILADNPYMQDAWEQKAYALRQAGRLQESLEAYQRAFENSGGAAHVALELSRVFLQLGRLEEARTHAELALRTAAAGAYQQLAFIALAQDDLEAAAVHVERALEHRGSRVEPLVVAAEVMARRGRIEEAQRHIRRAERELERLGRQQMPLGFHLVRGDVAARLGELDRAEEEFLLEIETYPANVAARSRLAIVYALQGREALAIDVLRRMVEEQESPAAFAEAVRALRVLGDGRAAAGLLVQALRQYPGNEQLLALQAGP